MASFLEHLCLEGVSSRTQTPASALASPAMKAIVVHNLAIINPHLATVVRVCPESIAPRFLDLQATCPTHSKVVALAEAREIATSVAVVRLGDLLDQ